MNARVKCALEVLRKTFPNSRIVYDLIEEGRGELKGELSNLVYFAEDLQATIGGNLKTGCDLVTIIKNVGLNKYYPNLFLMLNSIYNGGVKTSFAVNLELNDISSSTQFVRYIYCWYEHCITVDTNL